MPFMYSISEGISMGVISYVIINLVTGAYKTKKTSRIIYALAVIFVLKYIYCLIHVSSVGLLMN